MKLVVPAILLVLVGGLGVAYVVTRHDLTCPGAGSTVMPDEGRAGTIEAALGTRLDSAEEVTREADDSKGFETVTFREYDPAGDLVSRIVVEGADDRGWRVVRVETCA
jgi:hypothetical protein